MKPEWRNEQAQVIAMALAGQVHDNDDAQCVETLAARLINTALLDAYQRGRREGMEEAAKLAGTNWRGTPLYSDGPEIADAIRAKAQEVKT